MILSLDLRNPRFNLYPAIHWPYGFGECMPVSWGSAYVLCKRKMTRPKQGAAKWLLEGDT